MEMGRPYCKASGRWMLTKWETNWRSREVGRWKDDSRKIVFEDSKKTATYAHNLTSYQKFILYKKNKKLNTCLDIVKQ